jgi:hypothetical protein
MYFTIPISNITSKTKIFVAYKNSVVLRDTTQFTLKTVITKHVLTRNSQVVRQIAGDMAKRMIEKRDGLSFDASSCKNKIIEHDGLINFEEFLGVFKNIIQQHVAQGSDVDTIRTKILNGFKYFDADQNQQLDDTELLPFMILEMGFDSPEKIRSYKEIQQFQMQFMTQLWQSTGL